MLPSVILLISVFLAVHLVLPLGTWLLFVGRHDDKTRLWFLGISLLSFGMCLVILRPFLPEYAGHQLAWISTSIAWLMMIEVFRRERNLPRSNWIKPGAFVAAWAIYLTILYFEGVTASLGLASFALLTACLCSLVAWNVFALYKGTPTKSLMLLMISMLLYILPNIIRVIQFVRTGNQEVMDVFKFSWAANLLSGSYAFAILLLCFGFWGLCLDKANQETNLAKLGQSEAEEDADQMRQLVRERDQLLAMNSRFSVIGALSSFSAMLVHDISQPIHSMQLTLDRLRSEITKGVSPSEVLSSLDNIGRASDKAAEMVNALRGFMTQGEQQAGPVCLKRVLERVSSFIEGGAKFSGITLKVRNLAPEETTLLADEVMLQRIFLNILSNSYEQLAANSVGNPRVSVDIRMQREDGRDGVAIRVQDNGSGFSAEALAQFGQPWNSSKSDGMGLALMLSKQLLDLWGGHLRVSNNSDGASGAVVELWLRITNKV